MKFLKKNLHKLILLSYSLAAPAISFADTAKLENPINVNSIPDFIEILLKGFIKIGIPVIALAIVYCGFLFVAARGNSEKLTKAKDALLYTCIGGAVLLGAWAIATMISATVTGLG